LKLYSKNYLSSSFYLLSRESSEIFLVGSDLTSAFLGNLALGSALIIS